MVRFDRMGEGMEIGKVADRDVVAERGLVYTDQSATRMRIAAERKMVPPIFVVADPIGSAALASFRSFRDGFLALAAAGLPAEALQLRLQRDWPEVLTPAEAGALAFFSAPGQVFAFVDQVLSSLLQRGVIAMPQEGLAGYNPDTVEIRRWVDGKLEYEQISTDRLPTLRVAQGQARTALLVKGLHKDTFAAAARLADRYLVENAFFDSVLSQGRLDAVERSVEPVVRRIERGERVIRRGFIVTETDMELLRIIRAAARGPDPGPLLGGIGLLVLIMLAAILLLSPQVSGVHLDREDLLLTVVLASGYFVLAAALNRALPVEAAGYLTVLLPTGLFTMLAAILLGTRFAALLAMILGLLALLASGMDAAAFTAASLAGLSGTFAVRDAKKRIDLIQAGVVLGFLQVAAGLMISGLASMG
ncbi:MAG TPA: hypothetical protein VLH09_09350, partial [Bryobacteraceae bacterium]|nr:hypothetical protein [Bryobacteraceae bacterium]